MTSFEKSSSIGEDMRSKEVEELLTIPPLEYFGEQVSACLESYTIKHKRTEMFFDAIVYILTEDRVVSREGEGFHASENSFSWIAYLVFQIQQINCQDNGFVRRAKTEKKSNQVSDGLNAFLRNHC